MIGRRIRRDVRLVTYEDVQAARSRIDTYIHQTTLNFSINFSSENTKVYLKLECQQVNKAVKTRGALSKLTMVSEEKGKGVLTVSSGNHGIGVSYAAKQLGIEKAKVIVPENTQQSKLKKMEFYGAEIIKVGKNYDEAHEAGEKKKA